MITSEHIIDAAKECGLEHYEPMITIELTKFAQHFYRQGVLDAAEKCSYVGDYEAILQMSEEVK